MASLAPRSAVAATGINHTINFQGKVVNSNGTNVADGSYSFVFKLYSQQAPGGTAIWTETKTLTTTDGIFQTALGDTTSLPGSVDFNTDNIFLGINFNSDGEMSPRIQFTASPYAFNSEKLGGLTASQFAQLSPGSAQSGFLNVTGNVTSGATIAATTSLQAPLVDTASAVALNIGTGTASSVTVGRATSSNTVTIQGSNASTWTVTGVSGTTTLAFAAPTATNTITFANAGGTVCTTVSSTCSATYQAAGNYLLKNAQDSSSASTTGALLGLTNTNTGAAGVLNLSNAGTNSALSVTTTGNPSSGQALIFGKLTNASASGNLIDLRSGPSGSETSKFSITAAGAVSSGTINGQTITSTASFTGTVTAATSLLAPLVDTASAGTLSIGTGTATAITLGKTGVTTSIPGGASISTGLNNNAGGITGAGAIAGATSLAFTGAASDISAARNIGLTGTISGGTTYTAGTSLQAPLLDTASAVALNIGTATAGSVTIGRTTSSNAVTIQGSAGSSWVVTGASGTTTINFAAPTATNTIQFPNAGGTVCTTVASTCSSTYQTALSGSYLAKNTNDTSSASYLGQLYSFTNSNTGAAGVLSLSNAGTNSALSVTATSNPSANNALIYAKLTNASASGNLLDLWSGASGSETSKFSVTYQGNVTGGTINGQTISSTASFTGTVAAATSVTTPLLTTANVVTGTSAGISLQSGNGTAGNASTGNVTIDAGSKNGTGTAGNVNIGTSNASSVNIGRSGSTTALQGNGSSTLQFNNGSNYSLIQFTNPTAQVTYTLGTNATNTSANICTSIAASCNTTYQAAGNYLQKNVQDSSSASTTGALLTFTNSNAGAAGVLSLSNAGTNSALSVTSSANASAGNALIYAKLTNASVSGNLIDLWSGASGSETSKFSVNAQGNLTTAGAISSGTVNGQTITSSASFTGTVTAASTVTVSGGGIAVTGNSNITGTLGVSSTLTVSANGASITGGINNNSGGITAAGAIAGATTVDASTSVTAPLHATSDVATGTSGNLTIRSGNGTAGNASTGNVSVDAGAKNGSGTAGTVSIGTTNATTTSVGRSGGTLTLQGNASSTIAITNGTFTNTIGFAAPASSKSITFGDYGGTVCTTTAASCSATYQAAGSYLAKNTADTSNASTLGQLYAFTNTNGGAAGVLGLANSGTNSALSVTASSNPTSGNALIYAKLTNASVSGNLLDLWSGASGSETSKFSVNYQGNVTSGTVNGQTITSAANFTGSITSANAVTISSGGLQATGASQITGTLGVGGQLSVTTGGASITGGINNNAGGITGAGAVSGLTGLTFSSASAIDTNSNVALTIGTAQAAGITMGRAAGALALQGAAASTTITATNASGTATTQIAFGAPTANVIYQFGTGAAGTYQICTSLASSCGTTYASYYAAGYVQLDPAAAQTDASTTNSTIWLNKSTVNTSDLVRLQANNSDVFTVQANGNLTSSGMAYLGGSSASSVVTVDTANFKVKIGTGTPNQGSGGSNATAGLYVSGITELDGLVFVGDNTNNLSLDGTTHELSLNGTARHSKAIRLTAEYAGAVLDSGGASSVTGTMTAGYDSASRLGYYKWTTSQAASQSYDVVVTVPVPDDFSAWTGTPTFMTYGSTSTSIAVTITDTGGTVATNYNASALTTSTTWTARSVTTPAITGTYTQGSNMIIRLHLVSPTNGDVRIGTITLPYLSRY